MWEVSCVAATLLFTTCVMAPEAKTIYIQSVVIICESWFAENLTTREMFYFTGCGASGLKLQ